MLRDCSPNPPSLSSQATPGSTLKDWPQLTYSTARPVTALAGHLTNSCLQERLKAAEAKRIEKERTEKYNKLKTDAKDARAKYREKYKLPESPPRSDAEEESESDDEEDGFGPSKKVEQDPMDRQYKSFQIKFTFYLFRSQSVGRKGNV